MDSLSPVQVVWVMAALTTVMILLALRCGVRPRYRFARPNGRATAGPLKRVDWVADPRTVSGVLRSSGYWGGRSRVGTVGPANSPTPTPRRFCVFIHPHVIPRSHNTRLNWAARGVCDGGPRGVAVTGWLARGILDPRR